MVSAKKKKVAQRNSGSLLHEVRPKQKETKNNRLSKISRPFGVAPQNARLTKLEEALVAQAQNPSTSFDLILTVSNPGITTTTGSLVLETWWETYRTLEPKPIAGYIRLLQEVIVGTNVIVTASSEDAARKLCYGLEEEVEERFIGFMPELPDTEVIFPLHDIESSFTAIQEAGMFILNTMWSFQWQVAKGAKP